MMGWSDEGVEMGRGRCFLTEFQTLVVDAYILSSLNIHRQDAALEPGAFTMRWLRLSATLTVQE